jgi:putative tricarboxylic transport membrane protein
MKTEKKEIISGFILLAISVWTCISATHLQIGSFANPGSGFFPFVLGMVTGFLSLVMLVIARFGKREAQEERKLWSGPGRKKVLYLLIALIFYGLVLETLGYTLTTFLLFIFLLAGVYPQRWYVVIGGALFASLGSYVIFQLGLTVQLPRGFLGF